MPYDHVPVFVAGGAGYLGGQIVLRLLDSGFAVVVLDDFSTGDHHAVDPRAKLIEGSVANRPLVRAMLDMHKVRLVVNAAGLAPPVGEETDPLQLYRANLLAPLALVESAIGSHVTAFIHVSGLIAGDRLPATAPPRCAAMAMAEHALLDISGHHGLSMAVLRLPEVAGCDPQGRGRPLGAQATGLVRMALLAALGELPHVSLPDEVSLHSAEQVRHDILHITDATAAVAAVAGHLAQGAPIHGIFDCGSGSDWTVADVLSLVEQVTNVRLTRRAAPSAFEATAPTGLSQASAPRHCADLGWKPEMTSLDAIVRNAFAWEMEQLRARSLPSSTGYLASGQLAAKP